MALRTFGSDDSDSDFKQKRIEHFWFAKYGEQFSERPKIGRAVWQDGTVYLKAVIKHLGIAEGTARELITWWWDYKVPILKRIHDKGNFSADPRPLRRVYGEFQQWRVRNMARIVRSSIPQVCKEDALAILETPNWTPPPGWLT